MHLVRWLRKLRYMDRRKDGASGIRPTSVPGMPLLRYWMSRQWVGQIGGYRFHGIHGRVIPFAVGVKLANMKLPVIAFGGDGATFSEGIGHLVHGLRSNYPITFVLHNNANYGLTTGQASALTSQRQPMNWSPNGIPERTLASMRFIFSLKPTFLARGFTGNIKLMTRILHAAIQHRGIRFRRPASGMPNL